MSITRSGIYYENYTFGDFWYGVGGVGSLTIDGGSVLGLTASNPGSEPHVLIGDNGGTGTASVTGTGSLLNITAGGAANNNAFLVVGGSNGMSGSLSVSAGGEVHLVDTLGPAGSGSTGGPDGITVGDHLSTGTLSVDDGGIFVTGTGTFFAVGFNGGSGTANFLNSSVLQLDNSTSSSSDFIGVSVGTTNGATGTLTFDASSATVTANGLSEAYTNIGWDATGTLNLVNGSTYSIIGDQAYYTGMSIGRYATGNGTVYVDASALSIAAQNEIYINIGESGAVGSLSVAGAGSVDLVSGGATGLNIGGYDPLSAGSGSASFEAGSTLHFATGAQTWINIGHSGIGTASFVNSTLDADTGTEFAANVGVNGGNGSLYFYAGSTATIDANAAYSGMAVGSGSGGQGTVALFGASNVAISNGGGDTYFSIGQAGGLGIVNVDSSTFLLSGANGSGFVLGDNAGSTGVLTVSNGGTFEISSGNSSYFLIGRGGGTGTMNVVGGTFFVHDTALGLDAGGSIGRGSGSNAQGTLNVSAGGNVTITATYNNAYLNLARDSTTEGTMSLVDSTLTVASTGTAAGHTDTYVSVGRDGGTGQLALDNSAASFTSANGYAGLRIGMDFGTPGASGSVVASNNSTIGISGNVAILDVGYSPTATADLQILSGSVISIADTGGTLPGAPAGFGSGLLVGADNGSIGGTVLIDGAGSAIQGMDAALIGYDRPLFGNPSGVGNGHVTITGGGLLSGGSIAVGTGGSLTMGTGTVEATTGVIWFQYGSSLTVHSNGVADFVGNVTIDPGSEFVLEVAADGSSSGRIDHSGGTINGDSLQVTLDVLGGYLFAPNQSFTLLSSTSPLNFSGSTGFQVTGQDSDFGYAVHENASGTQIDFLALNNGDGTGSADLDLGAASMSAATVDYDTDLGRGGFTGGSLFDGFAVNVDSILGTAAGDTVNVFGSAGMIVDGRGGDDTLNGSAGIDNLSGGAGDDTVEGGDGDDTLDGGTNTAIGDTASYAGASGGVTVSLLLQGSAQNTGGAGLDTLTGFENLAGSGFDDTLTGNSGTNRLAGDEGDDTLSGRGGADHLDGGGNGAMGDTASYAGSAVGVTVSLNTGTGTGGDAEGDTLVNIENLIGSAHADTLTGNGAVNRLWGGDGNDVLNASLAGDFLYGEGDDDTLIGGAGADLLDGGANGTAGDTASYSNSAAGVTVDLGAGTASGGDAEGDTLTDIENLIGSAQADTLTGDGNANALTGGDGGDTLAGGGGADTLYGNNGDDMLVGGDGADYLHGGAGSDTVSYAGGAVGVTARIGITGSGGEAAGDVYMAVENFIGTDQDDRLDGSVAVNRLQGMGGNDYLVGGDASDILEGGDGNDTLVGGNGGDTLDGGDGVDTANYYSSTTGVWVNLLAGTASLGHASGDTLVSIENVTGSYAGANRLTGDNGDNVLIGYAGADRLTGNGGNDTLYGGNDTVRDLFIYSSAGFGQDSVRQFHNGEDIIDLRGLGLTFADVHAVQSGTSTVLTFTGLAGDQITLTSFTATNIDATDFYF